MMAAAIVLTWLAVLLAIVGALAWRTRSQQPPVRDSELDSTVSAIAADPPDTVDVDLARSPVTVPAARVWKDQPPGWVNTVPSGPMPFFDQEPKP